MKGTQRGKDNAPQFKLEDGTILNLRGLRDTVILHYQQKYLEKHPEPLPPRRILANGEEWYDRKDETFISQHSRWATAFNKGNVDFILQYGVITEPPPHWDSIFPVESDEERKLHWLYEKIDSRDRGDGTSEISDLTTAIASIYNVVQEAVEDSLKKSERDTIEAET